MPPLRIGIAGCGWAGERHARALLEFPERAVIVAVADVDESVAEARAEEWRAEAWYRDYQSLIASADLDAVSLCLPHALHADASVTAASAGLHVLVEKPLAHSIAAAREMIVAADRAGVVLMVAETVRFNPALVRAAELVKAGLVGDVLLLRVERLHRMHYYLRARPWFLSDPAAGIMMSGGIHDFETVRMLGGEIEHVYALRARQDLVEMYADDSSVALVGLKSGAVATVIESFSARTYDTSVQIEVVGSKASMWIEGGSIRVYRGDSDGDPALLREVAVEPGDAFRNEIDHFLDCVRSGCEPLTNGRDQLAPLAAVCAAYRSMETGRRVYLKELLPERRPVDERRG